VEKRKPKTGGGVEKENVIRLRITEIREEDVTKGCASSNSGGAKKHLYRRACQVKEGLDDKVVTS